MSSNLRLELLNLDNEDYPVSEDFSKKVMQNIHNNHKSSKIGRVLSILSVACSFTVCFIIANKAGIIKLNDINFKNFTESFYSSDELKVSSNTTEGNSSEAMVEETIFDSSLVQAPRAGNSATLDQAMQELKEDLSEDTDSLNYETYTVDNIANNKSIEVDTSNLKQYQKLMTKSDYLNEILKLLKANGYKAILKEDEDTIVTNGTIDDVYTLLEAYVNIVIEKSGEMLHIKLN